MTPVNDHLSLLERALEGMRGIVIPEHELPSALWLVALLRSPITTETINEHLERNAQAQSIAGYFFHLANKLTKEAKSTLDSISSTLYNGERAAGLQGRHPKAPPQAVLENSVKINPRFTEQQAILTRLEYCRDTLKDLRDCISSRSRHLEQISNNYRLEGRIDSAA